MEAETVLGSIVKDGFIGFILIESGDRMSFTDLLAANVDDWYTRCTNGMIQCFNSG